MRVFKPDFEMDGTIIITSISAFATVISAIIYWFTLRELKRQRENTARPQLIIDETNFYLFSGYIGDNISPINWSRGENFNPINAEDQPYFNLPCYNIGFGTATNVIATFSFDIEKFVSKLKTLEQKIPVEDRIEILLEDLSICFSYSNKKPRENITVMYQQHLIDKLPYVFPIQISQSSAEILMPSHYLHLITIYVFYMNKIRGNRIFNDQLEAWSYDILPISLDLEYLDINKKRFKDSFTIVTKFELVGKTECTGRLQIC